MKLLPLLATISIMLAPILAQDAIVNNQCSFTVYVQSFPQDGSAAGVLTELTSGSTYTETFLPSGSTIKLALDKTLTTPLFFGYSFRRDINYAYYEFSNQWGNPFANYSNSLSAGAGCPDAFNCAANDTSCYSTPPSAQKVYGCPQPVNLTATLCG